jgi:hypothetical protein
MIWKISRVRERSSCPLLWLERYSLQPRASTREGVRAAGDQDAMIALGSPQAVLVLRYRRHRRCKWKVNGTRLRGRTEFGNLCFRGSYIPQREQKFQPGQDAPSVPHRLDISSSSRGEKRPVVGRAKPSHGSFECFSSPPLPQNLNDPIPTGRGREPQSARTSAFC